MLRNWNYTEKHEITRPILEDNRLRQQARVSKSTGRKILALWRSMMAIWG
jgi:hypothetical protein